MAAGSDRAPPCSATGLRVRWIAEDPACGIAGVGERANRDLFLDGLFGTVDERALFDRRRVSCGPQLVRVALTGERSVGDPVGIDGLVDPADRVLGARVGRLVGELCPRSSTRPKVSDLRSKFGNLLGRVWRPVGEDPIQMLALPAKFRKVCAVGEVSDRLDLGCEFGDGWTARPPVAASISRRRREKCRTNSRETPAASAVPLTTGPNSTPSRLKR